VRKIKRSLLVLLLLLPLLSGCWNQQELTDLAFVMGIGIDKGSEDYRYMVTFQVVIPGNVTSGHEGGGGGGGIPIMISKSEGDTLTEAARKATKSISRRLYYAHSNLVVIGEELAKEGILDTLDALERDPEFRTTTQIIIGRDSKAEEILTTLTNIDKLPVEKITKGLKGTEKRLGENIQVTVDDLISAIVSKGKEPLISGYKVFGKKEKGKTNENLETTVPHARLDTDGMAVMKDGKLIGWLDDENARGAVWVLDKVESTGINIDWNGKKNALNVTPIRSKTRVSAEVKNGKPLITVFIEEEGNLSEANTELDIMDEEVITKLEKKVEEKIKLQVEGAIKEAQKQKSDVFGFGEKVHRADPKYWKKVQGQWNEHFAELKPEVKVDFYYRRSGIRTNPFWSDL
jgi:spore germination protein KC